MAIREANKAQVAEGAEDDRFPLYPQRMVADVRRALPSEGTKGHRVESAEGFLPLLKQCLREPGVHVIDCPVDYSENDFILNHELKRRSAVA